MKVGRMGEPAGDYTPLTSFVIPSAQTTTGHVAKWSAGLLLKETGRWLKLYDQPWCHDRFFKGHRRWRHHLARQRTATSLEILTCSLKHTYY